MPTKKKSPKPRQPSIMKLLSEAAGLAVRVKALEAHDPERTIRRLGEVENRVDRLMAKDCAKATMEALVYAPDYIRVTDIHGRLIYWANSHARSLRIVDMDDGHLKNAIAYLRRGAGSLTDPQRAEFQEALAYEHGRRNALKGI